MGCICGKEDSLEKPLLADGSKVNSSRLSPIPESGHSTHSSNSDESAPSSPLSRGGETKDLGLFRNLQRGKNLTFVFNSKQTLRKVHKHKKGSTRHTLHKRLQAMLSSNSVKMYDVVKLPERQDRLEWLAVHVVDFFNEVCLLFGAIMDVCTDESCPTMAAGRCTYLWADGINVVRPKKVSAHKYVDYLMSWTDGQIKDLEVLEGRDPREVTKSIKKIFKRMFRVYAHMYDKHFKQFLELAAETHLNTCFERFVYFILEFNLVDDKELEPLRALVNRYKLNKAEAS